MGYRNGVKYKSVTVRDGPSTTPGQERCSHSPRFPEGSLSLFPHSHLAPPPPHRHRLLGLAVKAPA